ncbi:nucleoside hydrolase-like domain-containing protein [Pelagicoccus sp. SDUM812002]|uniref:nucleoside hydrolase-like domain-containing protein n=1 Tax=Pelagicoccus sp. SDUM812002 TaxID=3041266 RepID=UPI0031F33507
MSVLAFSMQAREKPRVFVLTDIENEPDDAMSLVRFLVYSNQWDVEALVATTSVHQQHEIATWRIKEIVEAYGKVRDNLELHEPGFPSEEYLHSVTKEGRTDYGMNAVGEGMDSTGSDWLIEVVDRDDPRPVWVTVWGGPNVLAQPLWKVRETRTPSQLKAFISKLRVYTISDQDDSGPWMREQFPDLFYIASPGFHAWGGYHFATWSGIGGDEFHARCDGANFEIVDNPWLDEHIRSKGPLGEQYPQVKYLMEGDTPTFLHLMDNGLGNPERPDWGGWGGRYEYYTPRWKKYFLQEETRPFWADADDEVLGIDGKWHTGNHETIWRWREAYQNDFVARMDWTIKSPEEANHPPVAVLAHSNRLKARIGDKVPLSAVGSYDPDGDELTYHWFAYNEAGSYATERARTGYPVVIEGHDKAEAVLQVPAKNNARPGDLHIILAVTDKGSPALTRYQRVIVEVTP